MGFIKKSVITAALMAVSVQGMNGGPGPAGIAVFKAGGVAENDIRLMVKVLKDQKLPSLNLSQTFYSVRAPGEFRGAFTSAVGTKILTTKDIRRLKAVEQIFWCSRALLTGISLRGYTFGERVTSAAYRFQLKDGASGLVIREGFLSPEQEGNHVTVRAGFPPCFNRGRRKFIISIFSSFPFTSSPLFLEKRKKERGGGGSLFVNSKKQSGSLVYRLHGAEALEIVKDKGILSRYTREALSRRFQHFLFLFANRLILYDPLKEKILYTTYTSIDGVPRAAAFSEAALRLKNFLKGEKQKIPVIDGVTSGQREITISWTSPQRMRGFRIFRSTTLAEGYRMIGQVFSTMYRDSSTVRGQKYWYRVQGVRKGYGGEMSLPRDGYTAPRKVKGKDVYAMIDKKTSSSEFFITAAAKKTAEEHRRFLTPHYLGSLKMSLVLFLARGYLKNTKMYILNDFDSTQLDWEGKTFYGINRKRLITSFYSENFFRILGEGASSTGLRESIVINEETETERYAFRGFAPPKKWGMVNEGDTVKLTIPCKTSGERMRINLLLKPLLNPSRGIYFRTCRVRVNNISLGRIFSDRGGWYSIIIPKNFPHRGTLDIGFDFRNVLQQKNLRRAFLFMKITLSTFPQKPVLKKRLTENAVFFNLPAGEVEVMEKTGETMLVPLFKAAGVVTEYSKNYKEWRAQTLLISTSDEKLKGEIRKALGK